MKKLCPVEDIIKKRQSHKVTEAICNTENQESSSIWNIKNTTD